LIDGSSTDNDSFSATVLGSGWDAANTTLVNIETLNLTYSVADANGFDATAMAVSTNTFNILGTAATGTITTANGKTFGLGTDYRSTATVVDNTPTLNLAGNSGTTAATSPTFATDGGTTSLTINVNGTTGLNLGANELVNTDTITVKGASNLTLYATSALLGDTKLTATSPAYTGNLTLVPSSNAALDFSDTASPLLGVRTINLSSIPAYSSAITLAELNTGAATVSSTATLSGAWAIAQAGSGQSDTVTVSLGSLATGSGNITATTIENLTINGATAATSAGALGTLALGTVVLTNGAGAQKLVITNSGNLTAGVITADTVDTTGVTGTVVLTGTMLNSSGTAFTGGSGNTTLAGSAASDSIVTGIGVDTINTSTGDDFISTGAGNDVINIGAGANVVDAGAENDNIISVTDIALLSVINGGTGTDTLILTGGGTNNDILTVSPLSLIENIVFMTGASPNPAFAGAALTGKSIVLSEIVATASATVTYVIAAGDVINLSGITTAVGTAGQGGAATTAITGTTTVTVGAVAT